MTSSQLVSNFDQAYAEIRLPTMLIERLKQEFDKNYEVSKRTNSVSEQKEKQPLFKSLFGVGYKQFPSSSSQNK